MFLTGDMPFAAARSPGELVRERITQPLASASRSIEKEQRPIGERGLAIGLGWHPSSAHQSWCAALHTWGIVQHLRVRARV